MKTYTLAIVIAFAATAVPPIIADTSLKDYSNFEEEHPILESKKDLKTGFVVGGVNSTELIKGLTEINGIAISDLEKAMRPKGLSNAGFLGKDEKLLDVMAADNEWVLKSGLTHQQLARHLNVLTSIALEASAPFKESEVFTYHGVRFTTNAAVTRGYQNSPFKDGTKTNADIILKNVDNGKVIEYSPLVPLMAERYGFYEGHGTSYRVDPKDISRVLTFLKIKEEAQQGGADQPATAPESKSEGKKKPKPESKVRPQ